MLNEKVDLIHSSIRTSFQCLERQEKQDILKLNNISLIERGSPREILHEYVDQARQLGFTPVMLEDLMTSLAYDLSRKNILLPKGRKNKKKRGQLVRDILDRMEFTSSIDDCHMQIFVQTEEDKLDLIAAYQALIDSTSVDYIYSSISTDPMIFGQVIAKMKDIIADNSGFVITETSPKQVLQDGTRILLPSNMLKRSHLANSDHIMSTSDPDTIKFGILRESVRQAQYATRRQELKEAIQKQELTLIPKFTLDSWPRDALMQKLRMDVSTETTKFIETTGLLCDAQDLKYQTLFRLTTYNVAEVFENGELLESYLRSIGVYANWRNILRIEPEFIRQFNVYPTIMKQVIEEQALIISNRLEKSDLPIKELLTKSGIFSQPGWVIQKRDNEVSAIIEEDFTTVQEQVPLEFKEIDPKIAASFHRDLHYIHTPRTKFALGLFIQGEDIPFSVLALDQIDRAYKQNVLLIQGYNPRKCLDLTRLYSKPGTPGNTSSSMFALAFKHLKEHYPDTQAIISAFMPSYATGVSMTSGGFDNPVHLKPLSHTFIKREIKGRTVYEHLTKRRQVHEKGKLIRSKFPLLPTIELMTSLQDLRYDPLPGASRYMVEIY